MLSAFANSSAPPCTSSTSFCFISVSSKYAFSRKYWYGQVRHSKRFAPNGCSGVGSAREIVKALLQLGQTEELSVFSDRFA